MNRSFAFLAAAALVVGASAAGQASGSSQTNSNQVASAATPQNVIPKPLKAAEIKAQLVGNTLTGTDDEGPFFQFLSPDGTFRGTRKEDFFTGTWQIANDQFCTHLDEDDGENKGWDCTAVTLIDDKVYWSGEVDQNDTPEATVIAGNPRGL
jgi:hypothetical protein